MHCFYYRKPIWNLKYFRLKPYRIKEALLFLYDMQHQGFVGQHSYYRTKDLAACFHQLCILFESPGSINIGFLQETLHSVVVQLQLR